MGGALSALCCVSKGYIISSSHTCTCTIESNKLTSRPKDVCVCCASVFFYSSGFNPFCISAFVYIRSWHPYRLVCVLRGLWCVVCVTGCVNNWHMRAILPWRHSLSKFLRCEAEAKTLAPHRHTRAHAHIYTLSHLEHLIFPL